MKRASVILLALLAMAVAREAPAQTDACSAASTLLTCGSTVTGNTSGFTADVAPTCTTTDGTGGGVWYRFVGTGASTTASLCGSAYDTKIRIYTGSCAALTCVVGNDDFCGLQSQVTWTTTTGVTYYILVHGFGASAGAYTLTITCAAPPVPMCYSITATPYLPEPYAGTPITLSDDIHSAVVNIGFTFCYNGTNYTQCVISSNNYVTFDLTVAGTYSPWPTVPVPATTPTQIQNAILNPWQDIHPGLCAAPGCVYYQTLGTAPNRRFVVSYLNVPMFSCTSQRYTSQTVLYEGSNCIGSFITVKPVCTTWNGGNAVHALHNNGGTSATIVPGRNNTQWTANNEGHLFVPTCAPCQTAASMNCLAVVLPLELLAFRGHAEVDANVLEWSTASEENTLDFTVERSADGASFTPVGVVAAAGVSHTPIDYDIRDNAPRVGANYYRLRTTDLDGQVSYSDVIAVEHRSLLRPMVHPVPATGQVTVELPEPTAMPATLLLRDLTGRVLRRFPMQEQRATLDLGDLSKGTYLLGIDGAGSGSSTPMVIE
ncbi:MAG: T9SS type A sorting domain-containing protein [Flavobacteriales bacterium]|nr:T9SS type A sorting domain-containing protein [Flavobacteriales bacterium]MCB9194161.1 T9SS type A sorting domain-containing protein [Flavobacteriales bacterium]